LFYGNEGIMSPCEGCHAGCCRTYAVPVTGADLLRIQSEQQLSFWEIACRWEDLDGLIARDLFPHFFFADEPETPFTLCLRQEESALFRGSNKCAFLKESPPDAAHPLGTARCGIHPSRPGACRVFPTKLDSSNSLVVLYDLPERGRPKEEGEQYRLCSRPWTNADINPISAWQDLQVLRGELEYFRQVATSWNRRIADWRTFPEFLEVAYAARVMHEAELPAVQPTVPPLRLHRAA
jgi:Fe-S-cluster containining protein